MKRFLIAVAVAASFSAFAGEKAKKPAAEPVAAEKKVEAKDAAAAPKADEKKADGVQAEKPADAQK